MKNFVILFVEIVVAVGLLAATVVQSIRAAESINYQSPAVRERVLKQFK